MTRENCLEIIYRAVDEINDNLPKNSKINKSEDEILFGINGKLDSLNLVNFIVNVEALLDEVYGFSVALADEKAMSQNNSPFHSIKYLADYICSIEGNS